MTSSATALDDDIFSDAGQPGSAEELSSQIEASYPNISREDAAELAEAIQLIRELEREIFLTHELLGIREEKAAEEAAEERFERIIERPAAEEIILAKQVSEEPEKSLPREDRSLIREDTKGPKSVKGAVPTYTVRHTPSPRYDVYKSETLDKKASSVVIEKEQVLFVPAAGIKRFMVTDPAIVSAMRAGDELSVTAIDLGKAFLHIWDSEGRRTVEIRVIHKGYEAFTKAYQSALKAAEMQSFKVTYSYDRYHLKSKSKNPVRSFNYTEFFHRLGVTGETPWGMTTSRLQVEGKREGRGYEDRRDISGWDFNLRGEDIELSLGDTGARFSEITFPSVSYQGLRFKNPDEENINYDIIWGARGNRMWGYKVLDWDNANYFMGARGEIEPADFIHFNATALRALEGEEDVGSHLYATGAGLNFLEDAIKIETEFARSKSEETDLLNHAYKIDTTLDLKDYHLLLNATYRDIDPDFLTVTGSGVPHIGELGCYFNGTYNPFQYLRLTGEYNVFRNRYSFNATETQRYNHDWRGTFDFNIADDTRFRYGLIRALHEGYATPTRTLSQSYHISHTLTLPYIERPLSLSLQYMPSLYRNLNDSAADYRDNKYTAGMGFNVLKNLYYDMKHSWHKRKMLQSGDAGTTKTFSTGLFYSTQILDTPFYGHLRFRYKKEYDLMDNLPLETGEDIVSGEGEIKYRPSPDFETYLRVDYKHIRGVMDHSRNREETRFYWGGSYLFDTTLRWGVGGSVSGFVFADSNLNGQRDGGERGLAGIDVYADETRSTTTDADGAFKFDGIKGAEASIMFDTKMLPSGYEPTTPNPQIVRLERGLVSQADFGVMAVSEVFGRVFNDVNMNGMFDEDDEGAGKILLKLDDGTVTQTMASGHYRIENVRAGKRTLEMDIMAMPPNLTPLAKTKREIEVVEGQHYEEDFPLYALRTIIGTVFIDKNGNGTFDAGEKGVLDVEVMVGDNIAITDEKGRFFLKRLKGGAQRVELNVESIPRKYKVSGDAFIDVTLAPEGEIREDVDFPLIEK